MSVSHAPASFPDPLEDTSVSDVQLGLPSARIKAWMSRHRRLGLLVLCVFALVVGGRWLHHRFTHVSTDDARIAADMVAISSRVAGWVDEIEIRRGDRVKLGAAIADIDDRDSKLTLTETAADLQVIEQEISTTKARREMIDHQTSSHIQSRRSQLHAAQAALQVAEADLGFQRSEFERGEMLLAQGAISQSARERLFKEYTSADQTQLQARAEVTAAEAALAEAAAARAELGVLDSQLLGLGSQVDGLRAQMARQRLDLEDRVVRSPLAGVVDATFVKVGEYIRPGQRLVAIHDPEKIWVDANIKETQIRHVAVGQEVEVRVDAYPDRVFRGTVERIGDAANSQFALLPSPNPSGNFTKIAQRLRVKISLGQEANSLRPGMMVAVDIDVRDD